MIYALQPWFGSQHGAILPTAKWGPGSLHPLFSMTGPGIKKGLRMQRSCWLTDLVPTVCYLMDWPVPADVEGAVLYQAFESNNIKLEQLEELQTGLAAMEKKLKA